MRNFGGGQTYGRTDGHTDGRTSGNSPLCPTGHRPFGAAAQKVFIQTVLLKVNLPQLVSFQILKTATLLNDSTQDIDRLPDMNGRWPETLPRRLLAKLSKPKGVMSAVGHGSVDVEETRDEMLNARFNFVSKGLLLRLLLLH